MTHWIFNDSWENIDGGCFNYATWRQNPQYLMTIQPKSSDEEKSPNSKITIKLQKHCDKKDAIGAYIIPCSPKTTRPLISLNEILAAKNMVKLRFSERHGGVEEQLLLNPGAYVIIPCSFYPNIGCKFSLDVYAEDNRINMTEITYRYKSLYINGKWQEQLHHADIRYICGTKFSAFSQSETLAYFFLISGNKQAMPRPRLCIQKPSGSVEILSCNSSKGEVTVSCLLEAREYYTIVCSPDHAEARDDFYLVAYSDQDISIQLENSSSPKRSFRGKLSADTGQFPERENPQYLLQTKTSSTVTISLNLASAQYVNESIGFYFLRVTGNSHAEDLNYDDPSCFVCDKRSFISKAFELPAQNEWLIIPRSESRTNVEYVMDVESNNSIQVVALKDPWKEKHISGEWCPNTAGGCYLNTTWIDNPQLELRFHRDSLAVILLALKSDVSFPIGCYILKNDGPVRKSLNITESNLLKPVLFRNSRYYCERIVGRAGEAYNLIPCTYHPGNVASYEVILFLEKIEDANLTDIGQFYTQLTVEGQWRGGTYGGPLHCPTWRCNPQYNLSINIDRPLNIGIILSQKSKQAAGEKKGSASTDSSSYTKESVFSKQRSISRSRKGPKKNGNGMEAIGFYTFYTESACYKRIIVKPSDHLIEPCFVLAREVWGVTKVDGSTSFTIVPATAESVIEEDVKFELRVLMESQEPGIVPYKIERIKGERPVVRWSGNWNLTGSCDQPSVNSSQTPQVYPFLISDQTETTHCTVMLIQNTFSLAKIEIYKIDDMCNVTELLKNDKSIDYLSTYGTMVVQSPLSRENENSLEVDLGPGAYAVCAVPCSAECFGSFSLLLHSFSPIIDVSSLERDQLQNESKRVLVLNEILATEKAYIKALNILVEHFMQNMMKACRNTGGQLDTVKKVFNNIPTLLNCNKALYEQLKETMKSEKPQVGKVFAEFSNFFRMYAEYTNNFDANLALLEEIKKRPHFKKLLENLESDPSVNRLSINDYYIMPVQRIPRYALLLKEVLKYTPSVHPDYENLEHSLHRVRSIAMEINEKKKKAEAVAKVIDIQEMLYGQVGKESLQIATPSRFFVRSGKLRYEKLKYSNPVSNTVNDTGAFSANRTKGITSAKPCFCYLFNDLLLITKPRGRKYELKVEVPIVSDTTVETSGDNQFLVKMFSSQILGVLFFVEDFKERDFWYADINLLIQSAINKQISKTKFTKSPVKKTNPEMQILFGE